MGDYKTHFLHPLHHVNAFARRTWLDGSLRTAAQYLSTNPVFVRFVTLDSDAIEMREEYAHAILLVGVARLWDALNPRKPRLSTDDAVTKSGLPLEAIRWLVATELAKFTDDEREVDFSLLTKARWKETPEQYRTRQKTQISNPR